MLFWHQIFQKKIASCKLSDFLAVSHLFLKIKGKADSETDKKIVYWKERVEFVFIFLMSLMLIYLFNPRSNRDAKLDFETKILF